MANDIQERKLPKLSRKHGSGEPKRRARNATETGEVLLSGARLRFAVEGYQATSLRVIARDAGVDVALISRYFGSKEGLFQAVLSEPMSKPADMRIDCC